MMHPKNCFENLHTITSLCLEKSDGAQFLRKTLIITKWVIFTPNWAQKVNCFVTGIHSHEFCKVCMIMRHYSSVKNIEWNSPKYVLFG